MLTNIRNQRISAGVTQAALAANLGVAPNTVSQWETGSRKPPSDKLPQIAKALDCSIDDLFIKDTG